MSLIQIVWLSPLVWLLFLTLVFVISENKKEKERKRKTAENVERIKKEIEKMLANKNR